LAASILEMLEHGGLGRDIGAAEFVVVKDLNAAGGNSADCLLF
jgi:hypothetical protein